MSCELCGSACTGHRCASCKRIARAEDAVADTETYECPDCGGRTSGRGVVCASCRGGSDD